MNSKRISLVLFILLLFPSLTCFPSIPSPLQKVKKNKMVEILLNKLEEKITPRKRVDIFQELCFEYRAPDPEKALQYAKQGIELSRKIDYAEGQADCLTLTAIIHYEANRYDEALHYYRESLNVYRKHDIKKGIAKTLYNMAAVYLDKGDYQKALDSLHQAVKAYGQVDDKRGMINVNNILGIVYNSQGKFTRALEFYNKSLNISKETGDQKTMAICYNNIGTLYKAQGYYSKAMENFMATLKIHEQLNFKAGKAAAYFNIATVYQSMKNHKKALPTYIKSLDMYKESGDRLAIGNCYNNIGTIYYEKEEFQRALVYMEKAVNIQREIGSKPAEASALFSMAQVYQHLEQFDQALKLFQQCKTIYDALNNKKGLVDVDTGIGACYALQNKHKKAVAILERALKIAQDIEYPPMIKETCAHLHTAYAALKQLDKAYQYHVLYKTVSDKLKNTEEIKKLTKLEMQYQFRAIQKEQELEQKKEILAKESEIKKQRFYRYTYLSGFLLMGFLSIAIYAGFRVKKKSNQLLSRQQDEILKQTRQLEKANKKLSVINARKDKFFSIIAHDLKTPFSALIGSLNTLVTDFDSFETGKIKELLEITLESSEITYALLENLLQWSRSQTGTIHINPEAVSLQEAADTALNLVKRNVRDKSIILENNTGDSAPVLADKKMVHLVMRNIISNAVKYTPYGGSVRLHTKRVNDWVEMRVSDTGIGIHENEIGKLFRVDSHFYRSGTDEEQGTGLGLILCREFIEMNNGNIWVESEPGMGSTFIFSLPAWDD